MQAWRSTCPRHTVWEDACLDGLVDVIEVGAGTNASKVVLTTLGKAALLMVGGSIPGRTKVLSDEVANIVYFLATEESSYVVGQVISPNGGLYL